MKKLIVAGLLVIVFISCKNEKLITAQEIMDHSINVSGGELITTSQISFNFRGKEYISKRNKFGKELIRVTVDSSANQIKDMMSSKGFKRYMNDIPVAMPDSMALKYANSVNSVHYFAYLPHGLNDKAVNKELLGEVIVENKPYYKIRVSFDEEGGGTDFEDVFIYWIDKEQYKIDYLAYEFHVDGGGLRFREAYNERFINGLRFVDYKNYKPTDSTIKLEDMDRALAENKLKLLSNIELENIVVNLN